MLKKHVIIVGPVTIDDVVQGKSCERKLGGVPTYAGFTFSRHNIDVTVVSNVAPHDEPILQQLYDEQISVSRGTSQNTTHFIHYPNGDARRQELPLLADPIKYSQIIDHLSPGSLLHLGPLYPTDIAIDAFERLQSSDVFISLDLQGYVRHRKHHLVQPVVSEYLAQALAVSSIIKAAHEELDLILHQYEMTLPVLMKRYHIEEMVITSGSHGGVVRDITGEEVRYQAPQVRTVADSTGAGDVFFATYLTQRFFYGHSITDSVASAAQIAAKHIEGRYIVPQHLILSPDMRDSNCFTKTVQPLPIFTSTPVNSPEPVFQVV
jgi:sugar/nucleoside kinase (ribokinase family)